MGSREGRKRTNRESPENRENPPKNRESSKSCNLKVLGESPNMINAQKWLGEGAKGFLSPESENGLAPVQPQAPVQNGVAPVQNGLRMCKRLLRDFCSPGSNYLLHPLLTTFGNLPFLGSLPELSDCNPRGQKGQIGTDKSKSVNPKILKIPPSSGP